MSSVGAGNTAATDRVDGVGNVKQCMSSLPHAPFNVLDKTSRKQKLHILWKNAFAWVVKQLQYKVACECSCAKCVELRPPLTTTPPIPRCCKHCCQC